MPCPSAWVSDEEIESYDFDGPVLSDEEFWRLLEGLLPDEMIGVLRCAL